MTYEKKAMTAFAQAALATSDMVTAKFANTRLSGSVPRVVRVEAPQVESTGGGKQARESIVLRPESGDSHGQVTCGFLDVGLRACEIRSFAALSTSYEQRFKQKLDMNPSEYDGFVLELKKLLEGEGFVIKIVDEREQMAKQRAAADDAPAKGGGGAVMIAIGVVAALVVAAVVILVLMRG